MKINRQIGTYTFEIVDNDGCGRTFMHDHSLCVDGIVYCKMCGNKQAWENIEKYPDKDKK